MVHRDTAQDARKVSERRNTHRAFRNAKATAGANDLTAMREYRRMRVKGAPIDVARDAACSKRRVVKMGRGGVA